MGTDRLAGIRLICSQSDKISIIAGYFPVNLVVQALDYPDIFHNSEGGGGKRDPIHK